MVAEEAFDIFQLSTAAPPADIAIGSALKELITGAGPLPVTNICAFAVTVPDGFVAVSVYVVVVGGITVLVPLKATAPTPLLMLTDLAPVTVQLNAARLPAVKASGLASNVEIMGGCPLSVPGVLGEAGR
jgi:hypothetical protein